jgi:hypothetical protein
MERENWCPATPITGRERQTSPRRLKLPTFAPSSRLREASSGRPGGYVWQAANGNQPIASSILFLVCYPVDREAHHFIRVRKAEFFFYVSSMGFDGFDAEIDLFGY